MKSPNSNSTALILEAKAERWPLKAPFHITGHTLVDLDVVVVTLKQNGCVGRGEAAGIFYRGENVSSMLHQIESVRSSIGAGIDCDSLRSLLPAGGARNAVDCALWDLKAQLTGQPVWQQLGLEEPKPVPTVYTLGADSPQNMAAEARAFSEARMLKMKLTGEPIDRDRLLAVRAARPDVPLSADANQGFTPAFLEQLIPVLQEARVILIEQPFPIGEDRLLEGLDRPIPIAADESAETSDHLASLVGRFDVVNIKLDKAGGLTEAVAMAREAQRLGLGVMVGNMHGTSLAMAPATLLGQFCQVADLDGPLFLRSDRSPAAQYHDGRVWCPAELWGGINTKSR